ncbi:FAD/NAD(P)-binding protein [Mahella australiensis]|uniref:Oxidoreductase FAD/NAD(P)-binding domain protein n=1 Tax=Mahella australiensis (strain DSM 15567 / CIP 107919 / 50-1 BON) TaxID=697281 RepID=F4A1Y1_MAHA5|nr:FAD/NAD(P)-binding protein [Mahella australiensis]AEE96097.1 oxidoreductase FAD/NAD(P)-binding domain protein [Mahella australiensis 50-1 BON]
MAERWRQVLNNPFAPIKGTVVDIKQETKTDNNDIKTLKVILEDEDFNYKPGQFAEVSVFGVGEAPFCLASSPTQRGYVEFSIKRAGSVTQAIHSLKEGDTIGVRGPFGNYFPVEAMEDKKLLFVAGGIGLAPLRSLINYVTDESHRSRFGHIMIFSAARSTADMTFTWEYDRWKQIRDLDVKFTIDRPETGWDGMVGFPHVLLPDMGISSDNTVAVTCGPPIMIKSVSKALMDMGFAPDSIITTLEMRMTCGLGKCGRCNIGHRYVCVDGPVFTMTQLNEMPDEY